MSPAPMLVVIVGPIASGKSTIADSLGVELRRSGRPVAVLDLDDVVDAVGGFVGLDPDLFLRSQAVFSELVRSWLVRGVDVIAHGPFISREEDDTLLRSLPDGVVPRRVLLTLPVTVALERVTADPDRMLAEYPEVLEAVHERFEDLRPTMRPSEWTFDTSEVDPEQIVVQLRDSLLGT